MPQPTANPRVLKARAVREGGPQVAFNFEDVRQQCETEIAAARRQAAEILEQARRDVELERERLLDDAKATGRREGLTDAEQEIETRAAELARQWADEGLQSTLPAMREVGKTLHRERAQWLANWEADVIQLAVAIAEKLVRRQIETNSDVAPALIREALQLVTASARLRIRLNPADAENLGDFDKDVSNALAGIADVEIVPDDSISPGGCLLETDHGRIDARLQTQLERIFQELVGETPRDIRSASQQDRVRG